ncbi:phage major capsid protein [Leifsonia shinshuensis]|uniref:HK97 family phage major capsid protein n=2 Tax=Leifsonia shinshuensis TaxID=150026 RepID=A0A853CV88_9MICO|nr:phage major capsid protein [Leifsonia shinshuensis]NYJ23833.1 HK97 family phage major capsid protein [Leifsonia shinshuensis]
MSIDTRTPIQIMEARQGEIETEIDKITETAEKHNRSISKTQQAYVDSLVVEHRSLTDKLQAAREADETRQRRADNIRGLGIFDGPATTSSRGGIYNAESRSSYFKDMLDARQGDSAARERLDRHRKEVTESIRGFSDTKAKEVRAISTTGGAGGEFVPPLWLIDDYIEALRPARATADALTNLPMPAGTDVINVPKVVTGTATAIQANQNTGVQQTDISTGTVSAQVITIAGGQTVAQQLFDQSPIAGHMDRVILQDLMADYARQVGSLVLNGSGTGGQPSGLITAAGTVQTYTDASPAFMGAGKIYAQIGKAVQTVQTSRFAAASAIVMHPRRWAWAAVQVDASNRAVILPDANGPLNASGVQVNGNAQGVVGKMFGLPVIVDPNIPTNVGTGTNQDVILVLKADDSWLYEGTIRAEVFQQTYANQLSLFARVYNYMALAHRLPQSIVTITGTGLVAPTF